MRVIIYVCVCVEFLASHFRDLARCKKKYRVGDNKRTVVVNVGNQKFPSVFNVFIGLAAVGPRLTTNEQKTTKLRNKDP